MADAPEDPEPEPEGSSSLVVLGRTRFDFGRSALGVTDPLITATASSNRVLALRPGDVPRRRVMSWFQSPAAGGTAWTCGRSTSRLPGSASGRLRPRTWIADAFISRFFRCSRRNITPSVARATSRTVHIGLPPPGILSLLPRPYVLCRRSPAHAGARARSADEHADIVSHFGATLAANRRTPLRSCAKHIEARTLQRTIAPRDNKLIPDAPIPLDAASPERLVDVARQTGQRVDAIVEALLPHVECRRPVVASPWEFSPAFLPSLAARSPVPHRFA
jgi:hypothetical protein